MISQSPAQYIIAIGASAGGMEAIHCFFDHTPLDQVSYVVIQHLSPDHQSRLAELLASHSKQTICLAENEMPVEANRVYVIPNKEYLTIRQGKLYLSDKRDHKGPHMTINTFFNSLASDQGTKAIGVILSGTGNDGCIGIEAIHEAGGWVIAQDPTTAKFAEMPAKAIATGLVNVVLAPQVMADAIQVYVNQKIKPVKALTVPAEDHPSLAEPEEGILVAILDLIKSQLPLDFSDYKRATIFRRIRRRMTHHNFGNTESYLSFLQNNPLELEALAKDFLISVTAFFRDRPAFEMLERDIIPALMDKAGNEPLKIWVAGCATGEEAYSLAILMTEYLQKSRSIGGSAPAREVKIFATDLDQAALAVASKGIYASTIAQDVLPHRLERFFTREEAGYRVTHEIRKMLIFARHDLVKNPPYCNIDLISCRNLLIYLNPVLQKKIFTMLHFGLRQGGYLLLGSGENARLLAPQFLEVDKKWKIYQKSALANTVQFENFAMPETQVYLSPAPLPAALAPGKVPSNGFPSSRLLAESVSEAVMMHFGQVGLCLDETRQVIQSFGDLTPYLLPKVFNLHLPDLLPGSLLVAFSTAFNRAIESDLPVTIGGVQNDLDPDTTFQLVVKPFGKGKNGQKLLLLLLSPDHHADTADPPAERFDPGEQTRQHLIYLEGELRVTRDHLQIALDKLESNTENMQSFNEELLSANEEMQSGNEELQSVNEELQTINAEHQLKIWELTELNDDLNNYFRSNVSGQLFVDEELLLKKFSPAAVQHINLRESDIGRPLHHITTNIEFETIVKDIQVVIQSKETITREVQSTTGHWYQVMVMAYIRQAGHLPAGAMVTFYDITDLVKAREKIEQTTRRLQLITDALPVLIGYMDTDQKYRFANLAYQDWFGQQPEELLGRSIREVVGEQSYQDIKGYIERALVGERLDFEITMPHNRLNTTRHIHTSYIPDNQEGKIVGFYTMVTDVTEQVESRREVDRQWQQLHTLFMEAPVPIVIMDGVSLVFQLINPAYQKIFPGRALLGKPLMEAIPELKNTPIPAILEQVYRTGIPYEAHEMPLMLARRPGEPLEKIYWNFTYQARRNQQGAVNGIVIFCQDVTEQVTARRILEESQQQTQVLSEELLVTNKNLSRTNVDLDNFVYTASHDLRSPINNIKGLLGLLSHSVAGQLDANSTQILSMADNSVAKLLHVIGDLTEIAKVQQDFEGEKEEISFRNELDDVLIELAEPIEQSGALITQHIEKDTLVYARKNLRSILYNLLSNALKYRSPERVPEVQLFFGTRRGKPVLEVRDNGLGLKPEQVAKLFTIYKRFHNHVEGTGIGLFMIKRMVENSGGGIEVDSREGQGTTFTVHF
jgi:two-component system CheB/CheR fusion protein